MAAGKLATREVPWCTLILVVCACLCHLGVLVGNMKTASALKSVGSSTGGWSQVALGIAVSLEEELDTKMNEVGLQLIDSLGQIKQVTDLLDEVVSAMGNATENATEQLTGASLLQLRARGRRVGGPFDGGPFGGGPSPAAPAPDEDEGNLQALTPLIVDSLDDVAREGIALITTALDELLEKIKPALEQVGEWILKFGEKIQAGIDAFSTSLDRVQKIFDQAMAELNGPGEGKEKMMYDTFTLFDVSSTGGISQKDLEELGELYGVAALQGTKPKELVDKYDVDKSGELDEKEYAMMVDDPDIPNAMAYVLRIYARKLSEIAGNVGAARMRGELSEAVVRYFQLVCSKNMTKVGWVSDALGNGSVPLQFTADVMAQLCLLSDDPNKLSNADTGEIVVGTMYGLHREQTLDAIDLMANTTAWVSEGFSEEDQPKCAEMLTQWVTTARKTELLQHPLGPGFSGASLLENAALSEARLQEELSILDTMPSTARRIAELRVRRHRMARNRGRAQRRAALFHSETHEVLLRRLMGGSAASDGGAPTAAEKAVSSGVPAKPETLQFALWLSWNASDTANRFQDQCFNYSSESSSTLDTVATQVQGMVKKVQSFINMMMKYATPEGIEQLEEKVHDFAENGLDEVLVAIEDYLTDVLNETLPVVEEKILETARETGEQIGNTIAQKAADPITDALIKPIGETFGESMGSEEAGKAMGDAVGGAIAETMSEQLSNSLSKMLGDKFEDTAKQLLGSAATSVADGLESVGGDVSLLQSREERRQARRSARQKRSAPAASTQARRARARSRGTEDVWDQMVGMLASLNNLVPQATDTLKFARKEVSKLSSNINSIFEGFVQKGPDIFNLVSAGWRTLWLLYFCFFCPLTLVMLYYAFWANGWFGGPQPIREASEDAEPPTSFLGRCSTLCSACGVCWAKFHDTQICFWSVVIIMQVIVLLIFAISIVLSIMAGVQAFIVSGCSQIYLLGDESVCAESLNFLKSFLSSYFVVDAGEVFTEVCQKESLLTCNLIGNEMMSAGAISTVCGFLATLFSLQMLIESACLHEMARYRRMYNAKLQDEGGFES